MKNFIKGFRFTPSNYPAAVEDKIQKYREQGYKLPPRKVLRTPEQLEGIRESAKINTALLSFIIVVFAVGVVFYSFFSSTAFIIPYPFVLIQGLSDLLCKFFLLRC